MKEETFSQKIKSGVYPFYKLLFINQKFRHITYQSAFISTIGNYFSEVAMLSLVETHSPGNSGFGLMGVYLCIFIPPIILILVTGLVADKFDKRKVMLLSDLLRFFLMVTLFIIGIFVKISEHIWILYGFWFLVVTCGAFFEPAREGFTPFIVEKDDLLTATTLDGITWMTCTLIGASLGGLVSSLLGQLANFCIDSITFLLSAFFVIQLFRYKDLGYEKLLKIEEKRLQEEMKEEIKEIVLKQEESIENQPLNQENIEEIKEDIVEDPPVIDRIIQTDPQDVQSELPILETKTFSYQVGEVFRGIKYLLQNPYLLSLVCIKGSFNFFFVCLEFVLLKFANSQFRIGKDASAMYGICKAIIGVSAALLPVTLVIIFKLTQKRMRILIALMPLILMIGFLLLAWSPNIAVFIISSSIVGGTIGLPWGFSTNMIQQECPNDLLGRVLALDFGFFTNFSNIISVIICAVLLDVAKLTPNQLSLVGAGGALIISFYYILWFILTCKRE